MNDISRRAVFALVARATARADNTYSIPIAFDFDWKNPTRVSRHTIGHGVVESNQCDGVSVARVVLTIQHLLFSLSPPADEVHSG
jgi:hypothetical protein